MGHYELIVILDGAREEDASREDLARIGEAVTTLQGEMGEIQPWGKRKMAYDIKGRREGFYASLFFQGGDRMLAELDRSLKLNETVLRHMVLRHDGPPPPPAALAAPPVAADAAVAPEPAGSPEDDEEEAD